MPVTLLVTVMHITRFLKGQWRTIESPRSQGDFEDEIERAGISCVSISAVSMLFLKAKSNALGDFIPAMSLCMDRIIIHVCNVYAFLGAALAYLCVFCYIVACFFGAALASFGAALAYFFGAALACFL